MRFNYDYQRALNEMWDTGNDEGYKPEIDSQMEQRDGQSGKIISVHGMIPDILLIVCWDGEEDEVEIDTYGIDTDWDELLEGH